MIYESQTLYDDETRRVDLYRDYPEVLRWWRCGVVETGTVNINKIGWADGPIGTVIVAYMAIKRIPNLHRARQRIFYLNALNTDDGFGAFDRESDNLAVPDSCEAGSRFVIKPDGRSGPANKVKTNIAATWRSRLEAARRFWEAYARRYDFDLPRGPIVDRWGLTY